MEKKTLVILHGWQSNLKRWKKLKNLLEKNFKVYLPYQPGFGEFSLKRPWKINDYCLWLKKYLRENKIKNPIIFGHSNGGRLAIEFIAQGNKVEKLILMASAGIVPKQNIKTKFFKLLAKEGKKIFRHHLLKNFFKTARRLLYFAAGEKDYFLAEGNLRRTFLNLYRCSELKNAGKIKIPTLILWGEKDKETPLYHGYLFNKKIKNSRLVIFKNAGHNLHWEKPKLVYKKIIKFCL